MPAPASPFRLRDLEWTDFDALVENYYRCYDERAAGYPIGITLFAQKPSREAEAAWFSNLYRRVLEGATVGVVAEVDGRAGGSCFVDRRAPGPDSEMSHVGELGILVHQDYRGRGMGTALMQEALRRCRGRFEIVRLAVFANNEGAKKLYRSLGFELCGRLPRGVKRGDRYFDEEWMMLAL